MGDFSLPEMKALGSHISVFIICDSPQKSSTVRKVYKRPLRRFAPALPEGEPLAGRFTFHWTPEARQDAKGRALLTGTGASSYNLSVSLRSTAPPSRGASGGTVHFAGTAKASPTRRGGIASAMTERLYEGKPFLCRKVRLLASPVSFWRIICYNGFAALPAHLFGRGGEKNGKYSFFYTVCRSKCSSLLYLQVA